MSFSVQELIASAILGGIAFTGNMIALVIIGQINQKLPEIDHISYFLWGTGIRKQHKQLYPDSKLVFFFDLCGILLVCCFPILLWSMGVFAGK